MALRINTEMVEALRYTLRKFVVNLEGPAEVYCNNKLAVKNPVYQNQSEIKNTTIYAIIELDKPRMLER